MNASSCRVLAWDRNKKNCWAPWGHWSAVGGQVTMQPVERENWGAGLFKCCKDTFESNRVHRVASSVCWLAAPQETSTVSLCSRSARPLAVICNELRQQVICTVGFMLICADAKITQLVAPPPSPPSHPIPCRSLTTSVSATQQHLFRARLHLCFPKNAGSYCERKMICGDQRRGYSAQKWSLFIHSDGHLAPLSNHTEMSNLSFTSNHIYLGLLSLLT